MIKKTIYNPMSKEFQDECKIFGLTGNQLTHKYKKEGKFLDKGAKKLYTGNGNYNSTNTCDKIIKIGFSWRRCGNELIPHTNAKREINKESNETKKWICNNCWSRDYEKNNPNSMSNTIKSLANCRTGNQNPNHNNTKGNDSQELGCELYRWIDLNKENDNHCSPLDCYDPKTGLYYQIQGRNYNSIEGNWPFTRFEREWIKKYENMICFCFNKDGNIVERIYKFPSNIVKNKSGVGIVKNSSRGSGWYEKYRVMNKDELKRANEIWQIIHQQINKLTNQ